MDCYALLTNGDVLNAVICPFINVPNFGPWFFALVILAIELAIYFKTEDFMMPSILGFVICGSVLSAGSLVQLPAEFLAGATILIAINFAIVLYGVFKYSK